MEHSAAITLVVTKTRETPCATGENSISMKDMPPEEMHITGERIRSVLRQTPPEMAAGETRFRRAAVIVPIILRDEPVLLFTRRTEHLPSHAGQICFPGGSYHASDETLIRTALRELQEEIGIPAGAVTIAGFLDLYETLNSGFRILPVVGFLDANCQLKINEYEVAEVFEAPLSFVIDPDNQALKYAERGGVMREFYSIQFGRHEIWGATAAMIVNLSERLRA